ncbi:MAG: tRNA (adenosine(37)-N6)-threonylcarbamoyltransferase complex dimerization subunit type 1 TsaB [Planctomycetes bacterium]|nr:tRNA (adenosine(37)-N6)-threonylcarbamoyltransferase complex dimerization subunit type 1 TsaB [Planctomycetota bacterium]
MDKRAGAEPEFILAFETSSAVGSVALGRGDQVLETRSFSGARKHAAEFLPTIQGLCRTHGVAPPAVREVYLSIGPGSFTGLRLGVSVARMLALATGARIVVVPTLEATAQNALDVPPRPQRVAVILDAKRHHVFAAAFDFGQDLYRPVAAPAEFDPAEFLSRQLRDCVVLGEGVAYHRAAIDESGLAVLPEALWLPRVETVYQLGRRRALGGQFTDRRDLVPLYVRPPEAEEKLAVHLRTAEPIPNREPPPA